MSTLKKEIEKNKEFSIIVECREKASSLAERYKHFDYMIEFNQHRITILFLHDMYSSSIRFSGVCSRQDYVNT